MVAIGIHDYTTHILDVRIVTDTMIPHETRPGAEFGMPSDHVLIMRHTIHISDLQDVQIPPHTKDRLYWQKWIDFTMTTDNVQKLKYGAAHYDTLLTP
jgi:hypothetical protein